MIRSLLPRLMLQYVADIGPASFRRWVVERLPYDTVQQLRRISDIMHERSVRIFNEKKEALQNGDETIKHQVGEGRDIMSILREFECLVRVISQCNLTPRSPRKYAGER